MSVVTADPFPPPVALGHSHAVHCINHEKVATMAPPSISSAASTPGTASYCAAKAGMMGFSFALAREVGLKGITVNTFDPGAVDTPLVAGLALGTTKAIFDGLPMQRLGRVEEVAPAAPLLASDDCAYCHGANMNMNGGDMMR